MAQIIRSLAGELVLVTGASGYIATHITQQLLRNGYRVRGTVRRLDNEQKVEPLRTLCPDAIDSLELVEADLLDPESWHCAVDGCKYVIHVASPFPLTNPKNDDEIIKPAVEGTLNVLKAVKQARCVQRVVLTSSVAAIASSNLPQQDRMFTESDWTNVTTSDAMVYAKSKTLAEQAAWDFVNSMSEVESFQLAVINPSYVMGPVLCGSYAISMEVIKRLLQREIPVVANLNLRIIDVRDVARAHIAAMVTPEAGGNRHILCTGDLWVKDIAEILSSEFKSQGYNIPTREAPETLLRCLSYFNSSLKQLVPNLGKVHKFDDTRMKTILGIEPYELKQTVIDMAYSMIEKGLIKKTSRYRGPSNTN